jgi:hypothetical protein
LEQFHESQEQSQSRFITGGMKLTCRENFHRYAGRIFGHFVPNLFAEQAGKST